jgi:hypothetical protein
MGFQWISTQHSSLHETTAIQHPIPPHIRSFTIPSLFTNHSNISPHIFDNNPNNPHLPGLEEPFLKLVHILAPILRLRSSESKSEPPPFPVVLAR